MATIIFTVLFAINVITFFVFAADRHREHFEQERISESAMAALSICGGAYGAAMAMLLFKTVKKIKKFKVLVPMMLVLWLAFLVVFKLFV